MESKIVTEADNLAKRDNLNKLMTSKLNSFLSLQELELLFKHSKIASFPPGDTLLHQGEKTNGIYIIIEGIVLVIAQIMGRGVTDLEKLSPGDFITPIGFIEHCPCPTSFIASTTTTCLIIPYSYFKLLSIDYPLTQYKILQVIAEQIYKQLKIIHGTVTAFISDSDMTSLSFFDRVIYSLNQPKKIHFSDCANNVRLQNLYLFNSFSKEEMDILCKQFVTLDTPKNCKLISEGEKNISCYLVIYGAIQSCVMQNNKLAKLSVIGPGRLLASTGCIAPESIFQFTYSTCEHSILCKLTESSLLLIKENEPELWYKLFNLICGSLEALKKSMDKLNIRLHIENYNR